MFPGNSVRNDPVRDDSTRTDTQQLRDIQELIAQLADVNKKLSFPVRATVPAAVARDAQPVEVPLA